ncbi:putative TPR domain-containing protein [Seiridium cardinale]|uniref:TPR domain-containing protein n=1 Tax=Seiridium cardinale TaxID=138064 RepID=A0ABR2XR22_9PEZI
MASISGQPSAGAYYDLGTYRRHVSTTDKEAQEWFNRGLLWSYGFNHEEAVNCFEKAIARDSNFAMAYWGAAYALGPNYNKPWEFFDSTELESTVQRTHRMVSEASRAAIHAPPAEQALVRALQFRYPREHADEDLSIWNRSYAEAMVKVHREFPDDLDVAVLCADALMNLTPWQLWDIKTGNPAEGARTLDTKAILDRSMAQEGGMQHPGLLHLYIHLMEMSPTPEAAKPAADQLRTLVPDGGHLNHMPTHIDVLLGDYDLGIESNQKAFEADEKFLACAGPLNFYTLYRMHDYHFCIYSAMFAGKSKVALETVARMEGSLSDELLRVESPPMADWLEGFLAMRVHALIRFGRWQDIIALTLPTDPKLYCTTTAMIRYAKAVAFAATADLERARTERELFLQARQVVPESRMLFNNKCVDILNVAEAMMDGEIEYRRQNYDAAFAHLREAMVRDDGLPYDEPWGWMQPTRHAYGALLMEQGHFENAAVVYAEDLGLDDALPRALRHPNNVWALHGYHECMVKLGRRAEAASIKPQLEVALSKADVPIKASCYCRISAV